MEGIRLWADILVKTQVDLELARASALVMIAEAAKARDDAIRQAWSVGSLSQSDIARITGLTRGRIHQIVHELPPDD